MTKEIKAKELNTKRFIEEKVNDIQATVGDGLAINALSGGGDSSTVTLLGHRALGKRLKTVFIENGLMREGEPQRVVGLFKKFKVPVEVVDARAEFFSALKGITDPEEKREAITQTFYKHVFGRIVKQSGARFLLQGTILTDVDETVAGIKRQHNVFAQLGIDPQEAFGYAIIEPLIQLRKDSVRWRNWECNVADIGASHLKIRREEGIEQGPSDTDSLSCKVSQHEVTRVQLNVDRVPLLIVGDRAIR